MLCPALAPVIPREFLLLNLIMPLLVLDRYLVPRGKRPIISPSVTDAEIAIQDFILARTPQTNSDRIQTTYFERWMGMRR